MHNARHIEGFSPTKYKHRKEISLSNKGGKREEVVRGEGRSPIKTRGEGRGSERFPLLRINGGKGRQVWTRGGGKSVIVSLRGIEGSSSFKTAVGSTSEHECKRKEKAEKGGTRPGEGGEEGKRI